MSEKFYVTTPIYYVNDKPHIGHAYTTILADVLSRYHRMNGDATFFLTGTDEHGQKVQKAAVEHGMTEQEQCDTTVVRFQELWEKLGISNDDFIRTTEARHKNVVRKILQDLYDRDLIYKAEYKGCYCVPCERFFTDKDLNEEKTCPECGRPTNEIVESNYFFKMGQYQQWLIDYIKEHPKFILPDYRANETLGFLKKPLADLCISRPKSRLAWGIELPFDKDYVCYVWFDALVNYISGAGYGSNDAEFKKWWPASFHLIGKDILTTHTVYWPTMLKAIGVEMPESIFAHGWWLTGQNKMSKSLGNVVNPMEMAERYGVDAFRFFLLAEMSLGQDASFSEDAFIEKYNSNLANDLGNLLSRIVKMTVKQFGGIIPSPTEENDDDKELKSAAIKAVEVMKSAVPGMKLNSGIEEVMNAVRAGNRYIEKTAPWTLAKSGDTERLGTVMYTAAEALRFVSVLLYPIMPSKMTELRKALGINTPEVNMKELEKWGGLVPGSKMNDSGSLFQRICITEKAPETAPQSQAQTPDSDAGLVSIDDFFKTQLKTAKVVHAEKIDGADKLLKLQIDIGGEKRQIVAGVAQYYTPEEIIGKTIVVVANLKSAKIRGIDSQGMLLAAKKGKGLKLITVDGEIDSGSSVG
ncbi:MAG: hypothetical protein A2020_12385 [Lentisphaerae bacterium GWF2_45_14]|nr:MAG: hypothetical protein A2020_12385 [Lentisphaerae bacterium GWF2_45_14]